MDAHSFSVLTYNIQHGADALGNLDLAGIARVLTAAEPDIVCLQEVDVHWSPRSNFHDEAGQLAKALGMDVDFAPIYELVPEASNKPPRRFGLAVLSRYPIRSATNHDLSRISFLEQDKGVQVLQGFQEVTVDLDGTAVRVFNTQLSWLDADLRLKESQEMLAIIGDDDGPTLLAGDMNGLPDSPEVQLVTERMSDSYGTVGQGEGLTFPATRPVKRIDYIFANRAIRAVNTRVIDTLASDHLPVMGEFTLTG